MKSILKKAAGLAFAAALAWGMTGCANDTDSHEHTFATEWTKDATHHWHAATCGHTAEVKDKAEHSFGEWTIIEQPSEEAEGKRERICSDCQYLAEEAIAKLDHVHAKGTFHEAVASTCKTKGTIAYYDCTKVGCEIKLDTDGSPLASTESELDPSNHEGTATWKKTAEIHKETYDCCDVVKTAETAHTFSGWTSNNDATKNTDGTKSRMCSVCQYKETVTDTGSKLPKSVGDFILKDGTVLSKDETPESDTVAAVIVRAATEDKPALGVGIVHNQIGLAWCTSSASGYNTNITALQGDKTSGYIDGSNSWALLVAACEDLKNATAETIETVAQNYPAFNYCRKYGTTNNLEGDLAEGWYLPTVAELYTIYQNKDVVDASLIKADGSEFYYDWYWSCCQYPSDDNIAQMLDFFYDDDLYDGYDCMKDDNKSTDWNYVCSVRAFN